MDISVIIPVDGRFTYLDRAIATLLRQEALHGLLAAEFIIIDNARTAALNQATRDVVERAAHQYADAAVTIQYIATRHRDPRHSNVAYPRNVGIHLAQAPVVMFTDADVLHVSETLAQHVAHHRQAQGLMVFSYCRDCDPEIPLDSECLKAALHDERFALRMAAHTNWFGGMCCSVQRADLLRLRGFEESFTRWGYEDYDFARRFQRMGGRIVRDDAIQALHQVHPTRMQGARFMKLYAGLRLLLRVQTANRGGDWGRLNAQPEWIRGNSVDSMQPPAIRHAPVNQA
jgi:predicted glycosyltransferase involved in capsule biosynthesis